MKPITMNLELWRWVFELATMEKRTASQEAQWAFWQHELEIMKEEAK